MKRIAFYILFFVLLAACQQREESTRHPKEAGTLEVSFAYGGNDHVKSHTFTSAGQSVEMEVRMNVEVGWKVSSDADWCIVDEEKIHHGNGTFQLAVKANDGFLDRDDATVTLSAGDFTTGLRVIQNGNIFILDKLYELSGRAAGSTRIVVNVRDDVSWSLECPEWISASRGDTEHNSGYSSTVVTLDWGENLSASRMGTVGFLRQGERTPSIGFSLYQFGNEYGTTEGGAILLAAKNPSPIEVKVPVNTFTGVNCPKWVSYESVVNDDNTASWYFYFTDNPSDTETVRDTEIEFVSASPYANVNMPPVKQDFYPAGGLLTAAGFKMFAERFNANGDIRAWL